MLEEEENFGSEAGFMESKRASVQQNEPCLNPYFY
jgi:hypothetical protein